MTSVDFEAELQRPSHEFREGASSQTSTVNFIRAISTRACSSRKAPSRLSSTMVAVPTGQVSITPYSLAPCMPKIRRRPA